LARYRGSVLKLSRKVGVVLDIKPKFFGTKKTTPPGQHGGARKKSSEYALQLMEKQKVRFTYGVSEGQMVRLYKRAVRKKGVTGTILLQILETRLDKVVYRSGLAATLPQARQLVSHGHILVDGKKVDIASYEVKPGQLISVREKSKAFVKQLHEVNPYYAPVSSHWIEFDADNLAVKFKGIPEREDLDQTINEALIIEYYSR
jgi:small subunit ribosomal protein S4